MAIDVRKVTGRRTLQFNSYADILAEVEQLWRKGSIRALGNWTVGQNFEHLAKSIDVCIDGVDYRLPLPFRLIAKTMRGWFLSRPFKPGFDLPAPLEPAFGPSPQISDEAGYQRLRSALNRIMTTTQRAPSPAFGELTEADWIRLHCRHAELHLSFLVNET